MFTGYLWHGCVISPTLQLAKSQYKYMATQFDAKDDDAMRLHTDLEHARVRHSTMVFLLSHAHAPRTHYYGCVYSIPSTTNILSSKRDPSLARCTHVCTS